MLICKTASPHGKGKYFHPQTVIIWQNQGGLMTFPYPWTLAGGIWDERWLYLEHLGEERDHTNHDEEQTDAINLPPLNHGIGYREGLQTHREPSSTHFRRRHVHLQQGGQRLVSFSFKRCNIFVLVFWTIHTPMKAFIQSFTVAQNHVDRCRSEKHT